MISKGRATNLGRSGLWNSVRFLPFFFHTSFLPMLTSYLLFFILYLSPCLFLLFLLDPFFISRLLSFSIPLLFSSVLDFLVRVPLLAFLSFLFIPLFVLKT